MKLISLYPAIDLSKCNCCQGCVEVAGEVFRYNPSTLLMEIVELKHYPAQLVDEAIKNCPKDCISWEKS
ncbi:ferredoxin [Desulforhopalus singaporensis]|uniref:Ferredoxin n=1 Tax=Desulforhopalus singaporensis TaxID=91360 RepID=A0A1H0MQG5_9BACT|nr:ferredoxin [Desulforhopalus singaporensis]SDO82652.1 ferredoxin [Desulforhopalus singaporensis]